LKKIKINKGQISKRQIIVVVVGFSITTLMTYLWILYGSNHFFSLLIRFRGKYINEAFILVIGLIILGFGLFDIYQTKK